MLANHRMHGSGGDQRIYEIMSTPAPHPVMAVVRHHGAALIRLLISLILVCVAGCDSTVQVGNTGRQREPIVGLPCEGCEAVFEGLPDSLTSIFKIAPSGEPGQSMQIVGTVRDKIGNPIPGVIVYAYHTNAGGVYPLDEKYKGQAAYRHGRLRGWAVTDDRGEYGFDTIRPAGYPNSDLPAHVHMHIIEVGRCTYYIDDILFEDDPRLTQQLRLELAHGRGGSGIVAPTRDESDVWAVTRDIVLGEKIPGYPDRAEQGDEPKSR
jgi:protocatechuate 3,4-dioxygenase beta subunit